MELRGKNAIVTGASRGIGKAIVLALLEEQVRVLAVARTKENLSKLEQEVQSKDLTVDTFVCDVANEPEVKNCIQQAIKLWGGIDICVNAAGIAFADPIEDTSYEDWNRVMAVNAGGTFLFCREVFKLMKKKKEGRIVNIASVVGKKGYSQQSAYTASKHAVMGLSRVLAQEGASYNIIVHTLCPGGVDTDFIEKMRPDIPKKDLIQPEDCAQAVCWMLKLSDSAVIDNIDLRRWKSSPNL